MRNSNICYGQISLFLTSADSRLLRDNDAQRLRDDIKHSHPLCLAPIEEINLSCSYTSHVH
jgi:hypothetical protein